MKNLFYIVMITLRRLEKTTPLANLIMYVILKSRNLYKIHRL